MKKINFNKYFIFLFLIFPQIGAAVEATDAAKNMLSELTIRESKLPISSDPNWHSPEKIVLVSPGGRGDISPETISLLESAAGSAEFTIIRGPENEGKKIDEADVLLASCGVAHAGMKKLKWLHHFSAGVENCLKNTVFGKNNILLTNMKGVYGPGIAEHVIAMIFSFSRGMHQFKAQQSLAKWNRGLAIEYPMLEIRGKTILIVGLGGIGTEIAWRANALGMKVIATRNSSRDRPEFVDYVGLADELYKLAGQADFIVNSTPLTSSTMGLFDSKFFNVLKPSSYFINIGRGKSVITEDLVAALKSGKLAGAGLDVVEPEPLPQDHILWQMPNVIITPHISGRSDLVMERFWIFVRENLRRYVRGERMLNIVNFKKEY
jgi:phosphoglycerate dehydrogenase-like enzyme